MLNGVGASTMPQQLLVLNIWSIRSFHMPPAHCVLLEQVWILDSLNLLRVSQKSACYFKSNADLVMLFYTVLLYVVCVCMGSC